MEESLTTFYMKIISVIIAKTVVAKCCIWTNKEKKTDSLSVDLSQIYINGFNIEKEKLSDHSNW